MIIDNIAQVQACDFPDLWAECINNGDVERIKSLYNEHAVLMPTFSPHFVTTQSGLSHYFSQLSSRPGLNVNLHKNRTNCLKISESAYVINGMYSFQFEVDGTLLTFPSRFTFVIDLALEKPILHHQSSQVPRTLD